MKNKYEVAVVKPKGLSQRLPAKPKAGLPAKPKAGLPVKPKVSLPKKSKILTVKPPITWDPVYSDDDDSDPSYLGFLAGNYGSMDPYYNFHDHKGSLIAFVREALKRRGLLLAYDKSILGLWEFTNELHAEDMFGYVLNDGDIDCGLEDKTFQYQISYDGYVKECDPYWIEEYFLRPFNEVQYQKMLNGEADLDVFDGASTHVEGYKAPELEEELALQAFACEVSNSNNPMYLVDAVKLGVWASLMWAITPEAEGWRSQIELFGHCYTHGGILYSEHNFYVPSRFKKLNMPARSCAVCHSRPACVSPVYINMDNKKISYNRNSKYKPYTLQSKSIGPGIYYMCMNCLGKVQHKYPHCPKTNCIKKDCWYHINSYRKYLK